MNQTNLDDTLDVLNDLLQTSKDGEAGFQARAAWALGGSAVRFVKGSFEDHVEVRIACLELGEFLGHCMADCGALQSAWPGD